MQYRKEHQGFTLFELMVAIAIFSVLGVMTWTAMAGMVRQQELTGEAMDRFRQIQQGVTILSRDLEHIRPRPVRGASHGDMLPALAGGDYLEYPLEFTRGGVRNPLGQPRSSMQRVAYRIDGDTLTRYSWNLLDRSPDAQPIAMPLIDKVTQVQMRFFAPNGEWVEQWPPDGGFQANPFLMPRAVDIIIEIDGFGEVRRLIDIPGVSGTTGDRG
ncbi:type II secretion system minor pseudopilin GspJ [Natronospira bacteriovora]|uniref:Type II secretion system protein J n=1 Tax=Natronospira bacteriovora TaxID=3069753 RepID=A0ABU0W5P9_9GAMM|nr:type II secretion system minor pseudopilin GspJ [Natronospira sp. AB-CW4]MDQ2069248.1 type II secretion system minor pseudopilin GspJ [Natronospira sp. AB-CW4]